MLTPDTSAKAFFILQSVQNSGKSVLTTLLSKLFTEEAVMTLDVHDFGKEYSMAEMVNKAISLSPDLPAKALDPKVVSKIKQITGNDEISTNVKYKNYIKFHCSAKLVLATNHPLLIKTPDDAFYERCITIPFMYSIAKEDREVSLVDKLISERDAIITKAIHAYFELVDNNYTFSGNFIPNAVVMNNMSQDDLYARIYGFVKENFIADSDGIIFICDAHKVYCENNGHEISVNEFSSLFSNYACNEFDGIKTRKRRESGGNAQSCIVGVSWR